MENLKVIESIAEINKIDLDCHSLIYADCLEAMKKIPSKSIDLIATDLPFQMTANKADIMIPFKPLWDAYKRVLKPTGKVVLFGLGKFTAKLILSNEQWYKYSMVWDKTLKSNFLNAKHMPLRDYEDICVFYNKKGTYNPIMIKGQPNHSRGKDKEVKNGNYGNYKLIEVTEDKGMKYPGSIIRIPKNHASKAKHRTEKPIPLWGYLFLTFSNEGDVILDNCCGCANSVIAGMIYGRNVIAIDNDRKEFDNAVDNVTTFNRQQRMSFDNQSKKYKDNDLFSS